MKALRGALPFIAFVAAAFGMSAHAQVSPPAGVASGAIPAAPTASAPAPSAPASAPAPLTIRSVRVLTQEPAASAPAHERVSGEPTPREKLLVASSDLEVGVPTVEYERAMAGKAPASAPLKLYLNGIDATATATLFARVNRGDTTLLRFHLAGGSSAAMVWKPLYRLNGLTGESDLEVALGWGSSPPGPVADAQAVDGARIAVAPWTRQFIAGTVVVIILLVFVVVLATTDAFRVNPPTWMLRYRAALKKCPPAAPPALATLQQIDPKYTDSDASEAIRLAESACRGELVADADVDRTVVGLLLRGDRPAPMPAFSLGRLQLGAWFLFAVCTGLFLWLIYGELPAIAGSVLVLLGISVGTAGASIAAQRPGVTDTSSSSRGLLTDLVTGFDEAQHVHRYQSVVANLLLLATGGYHVATELAFPTFDSTWLVFLGISGAAFAGGKQVLEKTP